MRWLCGFVIVWLLAHGVASGAAATSAAAIAGGYGRLAIDWDEPVALSSRRVGDGIEITASRPFPPNVASVPPALATLLATVTLDDGARTLTVRPVAGVSAEAAIAGPRSLRMGFYAPEAPVLGLRLGRHDTFRRIVIEPVDRERVRLDREGERIALTLPGRLAPADLERLRHVPSVAAVAVAGDQLFLAFASDSAVRDLFVAPDKQVLDISVSGTSEAGFVAMAKGPAQASVAARSAGGLQPARAQPPPPTEPLTQLEPPPDENEQARGADVGSLPESTTGLPLSSLDEGPNEGMTLHLPWVVPTLDTLRIDASRMADGTVELRFAWADPVPAAAFVRGSRLWIAFAATSRSIDIDSASFIQAAQRVVQAIRQEPHTTATLFQLSLHDAEVTGFERDGGQWRVRFAQDGAGTMPHVLRLLPLQVDPVGEGLRLPAVEAVLAFVDPVVGDRLEIGLASAVTGPLPSARRFVGLRLMPSLQGAVWQRLVGEGHLPAPAADGLVLGPRDGIVREPRNDAPPAPSPVVASLEAAPLASDRPLNTVPLPSLEAAAEATAPTEESEATELPMATSSTMPAEDGAGPAVGEERADASPVVTETAGAASPVHPSPLGLARLADAWGQRFWERRAALLQAMNEAPTDEREVAQLDLARLHVVNGLGTEAVSLLAGMAQPDTGREDASAASATKRALEGVARQLAGQHDAALALLVDPSLLADDEVALWRAAARAALHDWDGALADWRRGHGHLDAYPLPVQAALGEHGAMLLLQTGQIDDAFALLDRLAALALPKAANERLRLIEATALERDGAVDEARAIWRALMAVGTSEARSLARLAAIEHDLAAGRITFAEAADQLAADSIQWRGQGREIELWRRLAALRDKAGQAEAALTILQETLAREPAAAAAGAITADMAAIMDRLFVELAAGRRGATAVLLAYRRFAELVPPGARGDGHVGRLAEELVQLGLDEAAMEILRDRLRQSAARDPGRAGLGLALAHLLVARGDEAGAIAALLDSNTLDVLEPEVALARRTLLTSLGHSGDASIAGEPAGVGQVLTALRDRARQAFDRESWSSLAAMAEPLAASLPANGRLEGAAAELVLMVATAGRQLGDDPLVAHLEERYAERLAAPDDRAVLRVLASRAAFRGDAAAVLGETVRHTRRMRDVIGEVGPA